MRRWQAITVLTLTGLAIMDGSTTVAADPQDYSFRLSAGEVKLRLPVAVEKVNAYLDGGTVAIRLKDNEGTILDVCLDGRLRDSAETQNPYHLFLGGRYPTDSNIREVPIGDEEEKTILALLKEATVAEDNKPLVEKVVQVLEAR